MTNGEKIQSLFPNKCPHVGFNEKYGQVWIMENGKDVANFTLDWWNAECKEPITENCIACKYDETEEEDGKHCKKCLAGNSQFELDKEFVEPTTKNDLAVDAVSRKAVINQIFYSTDNNGDVVLGSALRERIARLPSVAPKFSSGLEKNSKKLEKDFGELDCISRADVLNHLANIAKVKAKSDAQKSLMGRCLFMVESLPSVTPQEPRWIPVSERLPDTDDEVLCWYEYYHWSQKKVLPEYGIGCYFKETSAWYGEVAVGRDVRVIAWMPLQPYREVEE